MNKELEELISQKTMTTPAHRGERTMQVPLPPQHKPSFVNDVLHAPLSRTFAFALIALAAGTTLAGTFQLGPEADLQVAYGSYVQHSAVQHRVLGVADLTSVFVDLKVNDQDQDITVPKGASVSVAWESQGASSCAVSPLGVNAPQGKGLYGPLKQTTVFIATCKGSKSQVKTDSVVVRIGNPIKK